MNFKVFTSVTPRIEQTKPGVLKVDSGLVIQAGQELRNVGRTLNRTTNVIWISLSENICKFLAT